MDNDELEYLLGRELTTSEIMLHIMMLGQDKENKYKPIKNENGGLSYILKDSLADSNLSELKNNISHN